MSDLHASTDEGVSWLRPGTPTGQVNAHPIQSLIARVQADKIRAEYLVVGGDMGDRADPALINFAWSEIGRVAEALGGAKVLATAGNHDVDSRFASDRDARGLLQDLRPRFPAESADLCDKYWSRHYVIVDEPDLRVVLLNSCAYHGYHAEGVPPEYTHGRIAPRVLANLRSELMERGPKQACVLVCHHHPHRHHDIIESDYDAMEDGERLLELLGSGEVGTWLVLHGHRHYPRVCYAAGGADSAVVFSAGSLARRLHPPQSDYSNNQFYLLTLESSGQELAGVSVPGRFKSWDYHYMQGWSPAGERGLPREGGFGCRESRVGLRKRILALVTAQPEQKLSWDELRRALPQVDYVLPQDLVNVLEGLRSDGCRHYPDRYGDKHVLKMEPGGGR